MDNWLKGLVAAACVVVIAASGYYVWHDQQDRARREELAKRQSTQRMCNAMLREMQSGKLTQDWRVLHVSTCVVDGYLSETDFSSPELKPYLDQAKNSIELERAARKKS